MTYAFLVLLAAALPAMFGLTHAEPGGEDMAAWAHHVVLHVVERSDVDARRFPVSFELDAATLAADGRMQPDGADLRITVGGEQVPLQTESLSEGRMLVTFQVGVDAGKARHDIVLHYGNPEASAPKYDGSWGRIEPGKDGFENELLHVSYGLKTGTFGQTWGCQDAFVIKAHQEDQFGGEAIPESWAKSRSDVTYWEPDTEVAPTFEVEVDGPIYKRVRFHAEEKMVEGRHLVTDLSQRVTFYRGCPFIKEEFENIRGAVVDTAVPGGMRKRADGERNFGYVAFNFDPSSITWEGIGEDKETRGGFTADKERAETDPRYRYMPDHVFADHLIIGVVNLHNGRGIGTCAAPVQTAYFVDWRAERAGYSLWPDKTGRLTRYLYYVEDGPEEVIARGKLLAQPPKVSLIEAEVFRAPNVWRKLAGGPDDWGEIRTGADGAGQWGVVLENDLIRVHYGCGITNNQLQTYIRGFVVKSLGESQGHWLDSAAHRTSLRDVQLVRDDAEAKTVRLTWSTVRFDGPAVSEVSIFPGSRVVRIDYLQAGFPHICDLGTPGGSREGGQYAIYGAEEWQKARQAMDEPELRNHANEHHRLTDDLHPIYPFPLRDKPWGPSPMDYHGWYILGVYDGDGGRGFARVVPADVMTYIKLLWGKGLEFFPHWRSEWRPYTSYLFAVTGGREDVIRTGMRIVDDWPHPALP